MTITPIPNERLVFLVENEDQVQYRVDLEMKMCECEVIHSRKSGTNCRHLVAARKYWESNCGVSLKISKSN